MLGPDLSLAGTDLPLTIGASRSFRWCCSSAGGSLFPCCLGLSHQPPPGRGSRIEFIIALESLLVNLACAKAWLGLLSSWPQPTLWWPGLGKEPGFHGSVIWCAAGHRTGHTSVSVMPRAKRKSAAIAFGRVGRAYQNVISKTQLHMTFYLHTFFY